MRRREFITLVGGATAWPFVASAQQPPMPFLGFVSSRSPQESAYVVSAFRQGLKEGGFVEGQNVRIEYRWAEGKYDQLFALAADLVRDRVAVIVSAGGDGHRPRCEGCNTYYSNRFYNCRDRSGKSRACC
jgi:putative tryptophan/tyrosine transport system substrate-binding protein